MTNIERHPRCAVVGGGISGIAAAHFLRMRNIDVEIIEKDDSLGGRAGAAQLGSRTIDLGGKNIGRRYEFFRAFAASLGEYDYEPFGINSSRVRNGKIVTLDSARRWRSTFNFLRDCPKSDVARFAYLSARVLANERNRYLGSPFFNSLAQRLDDAPLARWFSAHFCNAVLRSMSVRMNGAEPDEAYAGNIGTNLGMWFDTYDQLRAGMAQLLQDFAQTVPVRYSSHVDALIVRNGRVAGVSVTDADGGTYTREYDEVVLATPATVSARLVRNILPQTAAALDQIRYFPVMVLIAEYERNIFTQAVRALTFGPDEPLSNAGAYGIDARNIVRYTLSGRAARPLLERGLTNEALLDTAESILNRYIDVKRNERRAFVARLFNPGLCAYAPRHERVLEAVEAVPRTIEGLHLTGDYVRGASIEACMRAAHATIERIEAKAHRVHDFVPPDEHPLEDAASR
ncbi:protoporphyrinogen/coproporphyrinogen oxidase [Burkholderia stagnalis]|uniref:protoporphyrinogen/coproporphyrinogen oxidase n=1 Tax=Burkholderia stagnalis TaxID=1503054 RepID=UPI000F8042EF|nr:FAD-dependent oxidoreductase [Burkholderia stagnalis]